MGTVHFMAYDKETGALLAAVAGSPADVADFLSIWAQNREEGVSLATRLGVDFVPEPKERLDDSVEGDQSPAEVDEPPSSLGLDEWMHQLDAALMTHEADRAGRERPRTASAAAPQAAVHLHDGVGADRAHQILMWNTNGNYERGLESAWRIDADGGIDGRSLCWLYCWATAAGPQNEVAAYHATRAFDAVASVTTREFEAAIPDREWAQRHRYQTCDRAEVEAVLRERLG